VNLLEKQLSTVYFKDVRFPWVTLYITRCIACSGIQRLYGVSSRLKPHYTYQNIDLYTVSKLRFPDSAFGFVDRNTIEAVFDSWQGQDIFRF